MPTYTNYPVPFNLTLDQVKDRIKKSIEAFFKLDSYLITNDLHEVAITHRLAIYLDEIFINYNVDCEWNKNLNKPKTINYNGFSLKLFLDKIKEIISFLIKKKEEEKELMDAIDKQVDFTTLFDIKNYISQLKKIEEFLDQIWSQNNVKYVDSSGGEFYNLMTESNFGKPILKKVRPDIIIHHRGTKQNIVVLEVKKKNAGGKYYYEKSKRDDLLKLLIMTTQEDLEYKYGFFIELPEKDFIWKKIQISNSKYLIKNFGDIGENIFEVTFI